MTTREFQVVRRRANHVDIVTPRRAGVKGYRFRAAPTFDGTFVDLFTANISAGYLDPAIDRRVLNALANSRDHVRCVFDPNTFNGVAAIVDDHQFWLTFTPIDFTGAPGTESAPGLILPDSVRIGSNRIVIGGSAPDEASLADSLQLNLPCRVQDFRISNNEASDGNSLFVSAAQGSGEHEVLPETTLDWFDGAVGTLFVRGGGGAVSISVSFNPYLPL